MMAPGPQETAEKTEPDPPSPMWPDGERGKRLVEHLKLIQAVTTRQNHSGFVVKGWSVTTTGAILAFSMLHPEVSFLSFAGVISAGVCWWLDAHFLDFERQFRCLYKAAHDLKSVPEFSMEPRPWVSADFTSVKKCALRKTVLLIHGPMMLFSIVGGVVGVVRALH